MPPRGDDERRRIKRRDPEWETLKRRVQLLAQLDGSIVRLREGTEDVVAIADVEKVVGIAGLLASIRKHGLVERAAFERGVVLGRPLLVVTKSLLATAHRDVRALTSAPARSLAREHKKALVRYGAIDEAWLKQKSERIEALSDLLRRHGLAFSPETWFVGAVELMETLHGEPSAIAVAEAGVRLASLGAERRRLAIQRVEALATALEEGVPPVDPDLASLGAQLERARDLPGRARRRLVHEILKKTMGWPALPKSVVAEVGEPLRGDTFAERVRVAGREGVRTMPAPRDPEIREKALEVLALYGLAFRVDAGGVPIHSSEDIEKALARKESVAEIAPVGVSLAQGHALIMLDLEKWMRVKAARWIRDGLELELFERAVKAGYKGGLSQLTTVRSVRAFATWATKLVPHYEKLGVQFTLSAELFANLPKNEDLGVLALCLMHPVEVRETRQSAAGGSGASADPIATLDATLGLFKNLPRKAATVLDRLRGTTRGEGRRLYPDFAAWLDDDALLDRMLHLARIGGEPTTLSQHLREDFEHESKAAREREHLERLPKLSERQRARLDVLVRVDRSKDTFPRGRTRRRLQERIDALLPLAYRRELDAVFEEILREAWGITVPRLTEPWRDAVRFWLVVDDNRELLGKLLRAASRSPGRDVKLEFAANRAWRKAAGFDVDAWLAPRREELVEGKQRYEVTIEEDPLEVLRMGIPFGTCLALDTGCNAAATVLNALDLNKRVVYVRADGKVVARKLLAVTKEERLVGYRLYVSVGGEASRAITNAVDGLCRTIGEEAGLELATTGEPAKLHGGFWYDDGTVGFGLDADIDAFCRKLALEPTPKWYPALGEEARVDAAMDHGDVEAVAEGLRAHSTAPWRSLAGKWLFERLGSSAMVRRARDDDRFARALVSTLGVDETGMAQALGHASSVSHDMIGEIMQATLWCFAPSTVIGRALAAAAVRTAKVHGVGSDYCLVARSTSLLARTMPNVAEGFALLDVIAPAWKRLEKHGDYRSFTVTYGVERTLVRMLEHWIDAPAPEATVAVLMGKRRSDPAQRIALGIAARHVLPGGERALGRFATLRPDLAKTPRMLAALVRQSGADTIDAALRRRLFRCEVPPFETLEDLVTRPGWDDLLDGYAPEDLVKWAPGPWEAAYYRRHLDHPVFEKLYAIASQRKQPLTFAHEKLAMFGDVARLEALADAAPTPGDGASLPIGKRWPNVTFAIAAARRVAAQVRATELGRIERDAFAPPDIPLVDRAFAELALGRVRAGISNADERVVLLDVFGQINDFKSTTLVHELATLGAYDVLERVLRDFKLSIEVLSPKTTALLYARGGVVREQLLQALAPQSHTEVWAAYTWAVERAAAASGVDAEGFLEDWALHLLRTNDHDDVPHVVTFDQFRSVTKRVLEAAAPREAAVFFHETPDARSCAIYLAALRKLPRDRAAAIREAATKLDFDGPEGAAKKAWLLETRARSTSPDLRNSPRSPIDQA